VRDGRLDSALEDLQKHGGHLDKHKKEIDEIRNLISPIILEIKDFDQAKEGSEREVAALKAEIANLKEAAVVHKKERDASSALVETLTKQYRQETSKYEERLAKLEKDSQERQSELGAVNQVLDALSRKSNPDMTQICQQMGERLREQIVPHVLGTLLKQQEGNVVQALFPKINPALVMVEEIYGFMKRVEAQQIQSSNRGGAPGNQTQAVVTAPPRPPVQVPSSQQHVASALAHAPSSQAGPSYSNNSMPPPPQPGYPRS